MIYLHAESISSVPIADNERSHNYGKGSVRKKGKKWYYRFYVEDASGNLVQKEFAGTESKSETERMLRKAMEDYDAKNFLAKADNLTLGQMLDVWAEEDLKQVHLAMVQSVTIYRR